MEWCVNRVFMVLNTHEDDIMSLKKVDETNWSMLYETLLVFDSGLLSQRVVYPYRTCEGTS